MYTVDVTIVRENIDHSMPVIWRVQVKHTGSYDEARVFAKALAETALDSQRPPGHKET
jgi:hypothetical protein